MRSEFGNVRGTDGVCSQEPCSEISRSSLELIEWRSTLVLRGHSNVDVGLPLKRVACPWTFVDVESCQPVLMLKVHPWTEVNKLEPQCQSLRLDIDRLCV